MLKPFQAYLAMLVLIAAAAFAVGYWAATERYAPPDCPAEDSCYPSYENGEWIIVQGEREQYLFPNE